MKDELIDILDEQGNKTGQTMMKSKAHDESVWHPVAHLWIYNSKGEVLIQKRSPRKVVWPNIWDVAVAGHIASGDEALETVAREAEEEIGLKIKPKDIKFFDRSKFENEMPGDWINRVYISSFMAEMDINIDSLALEEDELSDVRWVKLEDLEAELNDPGKDDNFSPAGLVFFHTAIAAIRKELAK